MPVKYYMNMCCASKSGWRYNIILHREVEPVSKYTHICGVVPVKYYKNRDCRTNKDG